MNCKKIRRIMNKYDIKTQVRKKNLYKEIMKKTQEHTTCANILNRQFNQTEPLKTLCTDITYLYYGRCEKAYLSAVKDIATGELVYVSEYTRGDGTKVSGYYRSYPNNQTSRKSISQMTEREVDELLDELI